MPIYRIRRYSGHKGGSNFYHHADVVAPNRHSALKSAKQGGVYNWRWVDTFDTASEDYIEYRFLYRVSEDEAKRPRCPGDPASPENKAMRNKDKCVLCGRSGEDAYVRSTLTGDMCRYCRASYTRSRHVGRHMYV